MLSVYVPFVSTGSNANPKACIGDSLYEWVINNPSSALSSLTRIRKDTYVLTDTVSIPRSNCTNITMGNYQGNNYIFTSSGDASGNIYRVNSVGDSPGGTLTTITLNKTDNATNLKNICCTAITYKNGYLWLVPSVNATNASATIIRLDIFNPFKTPSPDISYNYTATTTDSQLTVYTGITSITANNPVSTIYAFGNYIFTLQPQVSGTTATVITKMSTTLSGTSGIISNPNFYSYSYSQAFIGSIASDNVNYIWMGQSVSPPSTGGSVYRMSLEYNTSINETTPSTAVTSFSTPLTFISAMKYGAGYLWVYGKNASVTTALIIQVDVTSNNIITSIPLISSPSISSLSNIDIYSEYMWMTDTANSALLKMKIYIPCFKEGTKILCLNAQMKEEYVPIENIRKGHLVKTSLNGFVPVCMIGKSTISNPGGDERIKNRLYKCSKTKYTDLFEDLYITGCHSILVNHLSDSQREKTMESLGDIFITDRKYRLMAYLDDRSEPYMETGKYTIWHLALENQDYYMNYGIYANGLLVESTSKRYMKELSGMKLIE
jgi:hypothetical protein